jgi:hypothetical protein
MAGYLSFRLFSSAELGECLNSHAICPYDFDRIDNGEPLYLPDVHDHDYDLQFLPSMQGMVVIGEIGEDEEGQYAYNFYLAITERPSLEATVQVMSFDYGAYGSLVARISGFPPGEAIARRTDTGVIGAVEIPYDANGNRVADGWEEALGIYPSDGMGDFDGFPEGDKTPGDGLSVYEEYRGLRVRGSWRDFNPKVKDMFVMNFGAVPRDPENGDWNFVIPNDAITSQDGFPGVGVPGEGGRGFWFLNANEGDGFPFRVVNFLDNWAHRRDVYAAIVTPTDHISVPAKTLGPIWGDWEAYDRTQGANLWMGGVEGPPIVLLRTESMFENGVIMG